MVIGETLALETYSRGTVSITGQRAKGTTINQTFLQDDPNDPNYAQAAKDFREVKALFKLNTQDLANKPLSDLRAEGNPNLIIYNRYTITQVTLLIIATK